MEIERTIRGAKGAFHDLVVPANAPPILKAFLIAFPDVPEERYATCIDDVQKELKMDYVQSGMMLGGFHPKQEGGGLHNTSFSPFKTALPILAIRHMHKADAVFLHGDPIHIKAYLNEFGEDGYKRMKKLIETKYAGADCSQRLTELENCKPL
ncbi:MAG: hypothetical protein GC136_08235 [Alphaproteobacteria bacterium]|nr:hypothetical protein [Alphaproteobacteria bacterium]